MRTLLFLLSLLAVSGLALTAREGEKTKLEPIPWPNLPEGKKLGGVTAVAVDREDNVYLFHRGQPPILVFDRKGKYLRGFGAGLIKTAHGLRLDHQGNVWTTDIGNHLVRKFSPDGKLLLTIGTRDKPGEDGTHFNKPADIAIAGDGTIYVADGYGNSRVACFDSRGKFLRGWGKRGTGKGQFHLPHAIVIDDKGRIVVGDRENNRVQIFDAEGKFLEVWDDSGAPYGLALDGGRWLVADGRANRLNFLNGMGKKIGQFGAKGKEPAQFLMPHALCVDSRGALYVAEVTGKRIQKFIPK